MPTGTAAFALHFEEPLVAHLSQYVAHHVATDTGAVGLDFRDGEGPGASPDRLVDLPGLRTLARGQSTDAVLELRVGADHHAPGVVEPGCHVVLALVPALRAALQRLVVGLLRLLVDSLQADVAADLVVEVVEEQQRQQLETIANLSVEEAKEQLISEAQEGIQGEIDRRTYELELRMNEEAEVKARKAIALAIQRLTSDVVSETTTSVVHLPSDDMKGRLIGREGRNIRALERATGVDLIIDDTPEAVTLSTFDPVRREIARVAVTKLVSDGRIHPARIEDIVAKSKIEVEENIKTAGQEAMYELGITGFHPDLVKLVGQLKYRYSYGHNILRHSIEVAFLAALMAGEIGANVDITKKAALLHDIGKAVTHEVQGGHAEIGAEIARKYNIRSEVVQAVEEHHNEDRVNVEAFLVAAADAISGARPGARRDSVEHYVKRLRALEDVATSYDGVEKAYAIQAGREIRIMVKPQQVDDIGAARLAREVVKKIEKELVYPGEIKVTVVRETRALGTAR
ncbi:MAG: ribonuclease Y [Chloroflexi bacterium]|nr:ribonuclease Y [Chloroflexota bacterium]